MGSHRLQETYQAHHQERGRYGFSFGEQSRGRLFRHLVGKGKRVVDIGCRDGTLTSWFAAGNTVTGLDIDARALEMCKERLSIETRLANVNDGIPLESGSAEVVVAGEILEHLLQPEAVVREVCRVLRPGGLFVGSVPNAFRLKNRLLFLLGREFEKDKTHLHWFSLPGLRRLLSADGMLVEHEFFFLESRLLKLSPRLFANTVAWKCVRA
jgi:2-polyprenyl-3-methyl-5-hydroxy-6-metoxy-1,4-benzoquinol methylase